MKTPNRPVLAAAAAALVLAAVPLAAFTLVENHVKQGDTFKTQVVFKPEQPAAFTGGTRIAPGTYDVHIVSMGDGSVRASFFDKTGRKIGEERGVIAIIRGGETTQAQAGGGPHTQANVSMAHGSGGGEGMVAEGGRAPSLQTFAGLSFTRNSPNSFKTEGQKLTLQIGAPGSNQILIGLQLPAIQRIRESAAPPAGAQLPGGSPMKK